MQWPPPPPGPPATDGSYLALPSSTPAPTNGSYAGLPPMLGAVVETPRPWSQAEMGRLLLEMLEPFPADLEAKGKGSSFFGLWQGDVSEREEVQRRMRHLSSRREAAGKLMDCVENLLQSVEVELAQRRAQFKRMAPLVPSSFFCAGAICPGDVEDNAEVVVAIKDGKAPGQPNTLELRSTLRAQLMAAQAELAQKTMQLELAAKSGIHISALGRAVPGERSFNDGTFNHSEDFAVPSSFLQGGKRAPGDTRRLVDGTCYALYRQTRLADMVLVFGCWRTHVSRSSEQRLRFGHLPLEDWELPENWRATNDTSSSRPYYYNTITNEVQWEPPPGSPTDQLALRMQQQAHMQQQPLAQAQVAQHDPYALHQDHHSTTLGHEAAPLDHHHAAPMYDPSYHGHATQAAAAPAAAAAAAWASDVAGPSHPTGSAHNSFDDVDTQLDFSEPAPKPAAKAQAAQAAATAQAAAAAQAVAAAQAAAARANALEAKPAPAAPAPAAKPAPAVVEPVPRLTPQASEEHRPNDDSPLMPDGTEFIVVLQKTPQTKSLGVDIGQSKDPPGVLVAGIKEGLVKNWNETNPTNAMERGDVIIEANGVSGYKAMLGVISHQDILEMVILKGAAKVK